MKLGFGEIGHDRILDCHGQACPGHPDQVGTALHSGGLHGSSPCMTS
jgi:hypothetical protein